MTDRKIKEVSRMYENVDWSTMKTAEETCRAIVEMADLIKQAMDSRNARVMVYAILKMTSLMNMYKNGIVRRVSEQKNEKAFEIHLKTGEMKG